MNWKALFLLVILPAILFAEAWQVELSWISGGTAGQLVFGADPLGSDGYNDGVDVPIPIPPPGSVPYAYFPLSDPHYPYFTMLERDIRSDDSDSFHFKIATVTEQNMTFYWNPLLLPQGEFLVAPAYPPGNPATYEDMRRMNRLTLLPGQTLHIRYTPTVYHTSLPPYFSSFSPHDGETGVSPIAPISFVVQDDETGVNIMSIQVFLDGVNITSRFTFTPVERGYYATYIHSEPLEGNRRYTLNVSASDLATPPHITRESITFTTGAPLNAVLWEIPLLVWTRTPRDSLSQFLSLGVDSSAGAGFDIGYDLAIPSIPPATPYAYFPLSDSRYPFISMLSRDIRSAAEPAHIWQIRLDNPGTVSGVLWDTGALPDNWVFQISKSIIGTSPADTSFIDMRNINHLEFGPNEAIFIRAAVSGEVDWYAPRIVDFTPPDGATNVLVTTDISCTIVDNESGVDRESIRMWVNGVEVSSRLVLTEVLNGYRVLYHPREPFPYLSRVTVIVMASDLAPLHNTVADTISFRTGNVLVPAWTETLYVYVSPGGTDTIRMELIIGTDEYGTDGFDLMLDAVLPPPPPYGPYAYFIIEDTVWNTLGQDIRSSLDHDITWRAVLMNFPAEPGGSAWVSWDASALLEDGNFFISVGNPAGEMRRANMRETELINLFGGTYFTIHYYIGPSRFCLSGSATLSNRTDFSGTIVRILDSEFVDTTDADGSFRICDIPSGIYTISFIHTGYNPLFIEHFPLNRDTTISVTLTPIYYRVFGYVTLQGEPEGTYEGTTVELNGRATTTDSTGYFSFDNVQPGRYHLVVSHYGYITYEADTTINNDMEINVELVKEQYNLCGVVTLEGEEDARGVMVVLNLTDTVFTDTLGNFCFFDLPPGVYLIMLAREYFETIFDTVTLNESVNLNYHMNRLKGRIFGVCSLEGTSNFSGTVIVLNGIDTVVTRRNGEYQFTNLEIPDNYALTFYQPGYFKLDTTVYLDRTEFELNVTLLQLPPPTNLTATSGLHLRVPLQWEPPVSSSAHLIGYRIYRVFPPFTTPELIDDSPYWCNAYIDRNVTDYYPYQYFVTALYEEGESKPSNDVIANPRPSPDHPEVLIYDFDNGGTFLPGDIGADYYIDQYLTDYGILHRKTEQDEELTSYNIFEYDLVIVCTGIYDANNRRIRREDINKLATYLQAGGRIYWEGADFGYTYSEQGDTISRRLFEMFGVSFEFDGVNYNSGNVLNLIGDESFFGRSINVPYAYRTPADQFIDEFGVVDGAVPIMRSQATPPPHSSDIRMVAFDAERYRTVASSVYIGGMTGDRFPNTGEYVFGKVLQFLLQGVTHTPDKEVRAPESFELSLYPNPFNAVLTISFAVPQPSNLVLSVFDMLGRKVYSRSLEVMKPGYFRLSWNSRALNGNELSSGVYFVSLEGSFGQIVKRAILLK